MSCSSLCGRKRCMSWPGDIKHKPASLIQTCVPQTISWNRTLSSKATNNRAMPQYSVAYLYLTSCCCMGESSSHRLVAVAFHLARTHGLTFDLRPLENWEKLWCVHKLCSLFLSYRHKTVSSICRTQTWKEQHAAAQTGHPAHHDHEQDVICRCQVGDSIYNNNTYVW